MTDLLMDRASENTTASMESLLGEVADEFTQRLNRGEQPDIEEYAARFPRIAALLRQVLPALQLLRVPAAADSGESIRPQGTLGDFRILREVGRGGMGVVYEAEQISLGRRVALKVLPFAGALDARQLQRFKNEAHAAAHLQHQNIVPVYFVGCERGVHFYAMQFIEGQTLAALIQELRQHVKSGDRGSKIEDRGPRIDRELRIEDRGSASRFDPLLTGPYTPEDRVARPESSKGVTSSLGHAAAPFEDSGRATQESATVQDRGALIETVSVPPRSSILDSPSSFFRTVANLGIQAAEALEHAHQLGVIHRDIKPGNIILDVRGNLWITDFGLAHCQGGCELTMSGDLLGTLRYMSPEQALAQRVLVDQRTDIYSLGVTLYELLTLQPAFPGSDRQEVLRQIAFDDPKPPRRMNKAVPAELETIVLKAMEKSPADRYTTSQELANDLRRYLEDKPIRARRPTLVQRARKWSRRHRSLVWACAIFVLMTLGAGTASSILIWNAYRSEAAAHQAEAAHGQRTLASLQMAVRGLDAIYVDLVQLQPARDPVARQKTQALLQKALDFYDQLYQESETDPIFRREVGRGYHRLAVLHTELGYYSAAEQALYRAIALAEQLGNEFPNNLDDQLYLAYCTTHLGDLLRDQGRLKESGDQYRRSLAIVSRLYDESPRGRYRGECAEIRRVLAELVIAEDGNRAEAEKYLLEAINLEAGITEDFRSDPYSREHLGCPHVVLGELLDARGEREEAERQIRLGLQLWKDLVQEFPTDTHSWLHTMNWEDQAWGHASLAGLLRHHHELAAAEEHYRQATDLLDRVVKKRPNLSASRNNLAIRHTDLGELLREKTDNVGAAKHFREAIKSLSELTVEIPYVVEHRYELARAHFNLGEVAAEAGQNQEAEASYRTALALYEKVLAESPTMAIYGEALAECSFALAHVLLVTGRGQQASEVCHKALGMPTDRPAVYNRLAWLLVVCPDPELRDPLLAEKLATKAVQARPEERNYQTTLAVARYRAELWGGAIEALEPSQRSRGDGSGDCFFLAMAHRQQGENDKAREWYSRAIQAMEKAESPNRDYKALRRIRAEAETLLRIKEQAAPKAPRSPGF